MTVSSSKVINGFWDLAMMVEVTGWLGQNGLLGPFGKVIPDMHRQGILRVSIRFLLHIMYRSRQIPRLPPSVKLMLEGMLIVAMVRSDLTMSSLKMGSNVSGIMNASHLLNHCLKSCIVGGLHLATQVTCGVYGEVVLQLLNLEDAFDYPLHAYDFNREEKGVVGCMAI